MLNMLRADVYRLIHTKGFWILQLVMIVLQSEPLTYKYFYNDTNPMTTMQALQYGNNPIVEFYILPLIFWVMGSDFADGTLKDWLSTGISRTKYFFSKLMIYGILQLLLVIGTFFLTFLFSLLFYGLGDVTIKGIETVASQILILWLLLFAIAVFSYLLLFVTRSSAVAVISAGVLPIIIAVGHEKVPGVYLFKYTDFMLCAMNIQTIDPANLSAVSNVLIGAVVIIFFGSIITDFYFDQIDL